MKNILVCLLAVLAMVSVAQAFAVDVFVKPDCHPCEDMLEYLNSTEIMSEYPDLEVVVHDVTEEGALFNSTAAYAGFPADRVPVMVSGKDYKRFYFGNKNDTAQINMILSKASGRKAAPKPEPAPQAEPKSCNVTLMLFWAVGCPHCAAEKEFLAEIAPKYPELCIELYETFFNKSNADLFVSVAGRLGFTAESVPVTVIGDWYLLGYDSGETQGKYIEEVIKARIAALHGQNLTENAAEKYKYLVELPFVGAVDVREMGVPLATVVIAAVDGFNPCAFFVLTMLLTFLVYAGSRKKMLLIGATFVFISGVVYFIALLVMYTGLKSITSVSNPLSNIGALGIVAGIIALFIGAVNIKDLFFMKKGFSFTIPEDKKPKLYKRMRGLLKSQSLMSLMAATIVLALAANSYELICTAALPFVYNTSLVAQGMPYFEAVMYLILYCAVYIMPLLAIVLVFVKKFEVSKMKGSTGELLKGISGFMMAGFGLMLILDPMVLNNITVIVLIVAASVALGFILTKAKRLLQPGSAAQSDDDSSAAPQGKKAAKKAGKPAAKKPKSRKTKNETSGEP